MKVFFVLAPVTNEYKWAQEIPPFGVSSIGAVFLKNGYEVFIYDTSLDDSIEPAVKEIVKFKPQIVGISSTTLQIRNAAALADKVKSFDKTIVLAAGGVHVTALARAFLLHYESGEPNVKKRW